jgi:hypothetical protein
MALTEVQAKDEMLTMFRTAWNANSVAVITPYQVTVPAVRYHGQVNKEPPPSNLYHAILYMECVSRSQKTLAIDVASIGTRRYNNIGILSLQIMCPFSDAENSDRGLRLGIVARDAFEGKTSPCGVWFRDAKVTPSLSTEVFSKHIMTVGYQFDEIK